MSAFGVYCAAPWVSFGDSGEFLAASAVLGIPHAPGYPLMALSAKAFAGLWPWASWAYRVNLLCALSGAAAAALCYDAWRRLYGSGPALFAVASLAFSPLWIFSTAQTEVFSLHLALAAAALWIFARWQNRFFDSRPAAALGLVLGLGGANHHTLILIVPALLAGGWLAQRPSPRAAARGLLHMAVFGLLGLALYLYLPLRARAFPPLDWGHPVDWPRFLHVLLRRDYGSFALTLDGAGGAGAWRQTAGFLAATLKGLGWAACAAAAAGLAVSCRRGLAHAAAPVLWLALAGPGFLILGDPPFDAQTRYALERFYLLPWLAAAWLAASAFHGGSRRGRSWACLLALWPLSSAWASSPSWNQRWDLAPGDYGLNLLRTLPAEAAFIMDGGDDSFYSTAYFQFAEGRRRDAVLADRGGLVFKHPYGDDFRALGKEGKDERRAVVEKKLARIRPLYYATLRTEMPPGPLTARGLLKRADAGGFMSWELYPIRRAPALERAHYRQRALTPFYDAMRSDSETVEARAYLRLASAGRDGYDARWVPGFISQRAQALAFAAAAQGRWAQAERGYRLAAAYEKAPGLRLNLGVALEKQGRFDEAEEQYKLGALIEPASYQAFYNLGALAWKRSQWSASADLFEEALKRRPGDAAAGAYAARARAKAGETKP